MALKRVAHIDPNGVYLGMVDVDDADLTSRHLDQIGECDLPPREYRWDGTTFIPLPEHQRPKADGAPTLEAAYYATLRAIEGQGITLPVEAEAWMQWYEQTQDGRQR